MNNREKLERMCNDKNETRQLVSVRLVGDEKDLAKDKLTCNGRGYCVGNLQFPTCAVSSVSSNIIYLNKKYLHYKE